VTEESAADRAKRLAQRVLFDSVAELYETSRRGYADELVDFVLSTAGVTAGDPVLEVGCGTGQLTRSLVARGVDLTSVTLAPALA
jgi:cyclopropane fatty-acyl-phospholipid synthase-like methyltransferase